jgi:hypothetical protein
MEKINVIERYKNIYQQLYTALKWKADKQLIMLIAAIYATNEKPFQLKAFLEIADYIKENVGMFSTLKSVQRFTVAATLDTTTDDPKASFHYYLEIYEKLIEQGFSRNAYTYIAAGTLLKKEPNQIDEAVQKTLNVYKGMKKNHFFLTSAGDYPLAALLSQREQETDEILEQVEAYYHVLQNYGFTFGNDLQFTSHILALETGRSADEKAAQCARIRDLLREANVKTKMTYYPYLGMLSFIENIETEIIGLIEIYEELNRTFKWNKEINFMMSVLFLINQYTAVGDAAKTGLNVSIEAIIQAQQAAITAGVAAAAASSSSSSN